ncbi:hypothetical protein EDD83_09860 [Methanohalophilus euhalobius]|uniref:Transposase n=1 Tax=Methanohalophilus euhalobius TaxID=51203 RepID=A0A3M9L257_9EURY|nr:hypothetical protein EDD83_09860 [Methanohalophilus euhalobius]
MTVCGDKLSEIDKLIDWKPFRPILESMYINRTDKGGRPEMVLSESLCMTVSQSSMYRTLENNTTIKDTRS